MKRVIVFEHDGGELGNQLWNYISVYAYCAERGYACENWSFYAYAHYFEHLRPHNILVRTIFFWPFAGYHKRRGARRARLFRRLYKIFVAGVIKRASVRVFYSRNTETGVVYLPPTAEAPKALARLEEGDGSIYIAQVSGGVLRNPAGIENHRAAILERFAPAPAIRAAVESQLDNLRKRYPHIVGVHLRQGDYKTFKGGKFRIAQERVGEIAREYLAERNLDTHHVCFVIASDGAIDTAAFAGLNIQWQQRTVGEDLFLLAGCEAVVGSDSTFGHFAAYWGNVPHVVMKNEAMDWEYYRGKTIFFPNKYLTVMAY